MLPVFGIRRRHFLPVMRRSRAILAGHSGAARSAEPGTGSSEMRRQPNGRPPQREDNAETHSGSPLRGVRNDEFAG
jgi:hypothetical protein